MKLRAIHHDLIWQLAAMSVGAFAQIFQTALLARTEDSREIGLLALLNIMMMLAAALQDAGISSFLIHRTTLSRAQSSTVFLISAAAGAVAAFFVFLSSWPLAWTYKAPEIVLPMQLLALNFVILGAASPYQANFIKALRLAQLARIELLSRLLGLALTIWLIVVRDAGVISIVFGMLGTATVRCALMVFRAPTSWHPTVSPDWSIAPQAFRFSGYQIGSQIINQLCARADQLILGRALGMSELGLYSLAKELILQPSKIVGPIIQRLALPRFAQRQDNRESLRSLFLFTTFTAIASNGLIYVGLALLADPLVRLIYGASYEPAALLIQLMAIFGIVRPLGTILGTLAQSVGRTNIEFRWNVVSSAIVLATSALASTFHDARVMAGALSGMQVLLVILAFSFFAEPLVRASLRDYLHAWAPLSIFFGAIVLIDIWISAHLPAAGVASSVLGILALGGGALVLSRRVRAFERLEPNALPRTTRMP